MTVLGEDFFLGVVRKAKLVLDVCVGSAMTIKAN
jgi:hypothetical protein